MWETWVRCLGREDSLEKDMATHPSTLAKKIPWAEEPGAGYCPWGRKQYSTQYSVTAIQGNNQRVDRLCVCVCV